MPWRAISLDLDDTLWPVWPVIEAAERGVQVWLQTHAPATAARNGVAGLRRWRVQLQADRPDLVADLSAMRRESLRLALLDAGDDPALAEPAFDHFFELRQQVQPFADVAESLQRLARRFRLVALSNGNADVRRVPGIGEHFSAALSAQDLGVCKPSPQAFLAACQAVGCTPAEVLHVGDHGAQDIDGAHAVGLGTAWIARPELPPPPPPSVEPHHRIVNLRELADRLGV